MSLRLAIAIALLAVSPAPAEEIDYRQRADDLRALSMIFGELHHIRRNCERNESEIWRERMQKLIDLEMPQADLREQMVVAFNDGFRRGEGRFEYCDRDARSRAASIAAQGDRIATRLIEPLYNSLANSGETPSLYNGRAFGDDGYGDDDDDGE